MPDVGRQTRYITVDVQIVNEKEFPIILVSILLTIRKKKKKKKTAKNWDTSDLSPFHPFYQSLHVPLCF